MKKSIKFCIFILILGGLILILTGCNINVKVNNGDEKKNDVLENADITFYGHTPKEWEKMIDEFYNTYFEYNPEKIQCYYNEAGIFIGDVYNGEEVVNEYIFDSDTGFAVGWDQLTVDFINNQYIEFKANIKDEYPENYRLAIGYVPDLFYNNFIKQYFYSESDFDSLEIHDFRYPDNRKDGYGNRFVIVPLTNMVNVTVYDCFVNEQDEIEKDNILVSNTTEPFIILDDYIEYIPTLIVSFEYKGTIKEFPITFSGDDGHLVLEGVEYDVVDISIY